MSALLMKELYNLKRFKSTMSMMLMLYAVIGLATGSFTFVSGMIIIMFTMMSITSFSVDETTHWDQYAVTLPISRRKLVWGKYLLSLILTGFGGLLSLILTTIIAFLQSQFVLSDTLLLTYVICVIGLLMAAILFPLIYKFGAEKVRLMMMLVFLIPFGVIMLLSYFGVAMSTDLIVLLLEISPFVLIAALGISYMISCKIMEQKEF
jgi:ABC-type transport system involved in multi-copper enzyme maturation permease subunit